MADDKTSSEGRPEVRRSSVISNELVQAGLSSEDDAAVLGMARLDSDTVMLGIELTSQSQPNSATSKNCAATSLCSRSSA